MNKLSKLLIALGSAILILLGSLFGTSILNNLHLRYLRSLSSNVVLIHNLEGTAGATGFVVKGKSGSYYIMTNNHVCELENIGPIAITYKGDVYISKVIKRYPLNDLCVMEAPSDTSGSFRVAKSNRIGESAYAIGHPLLEPLSVSVGELSDFINVSIVVKTNPEPAECVGPTYSINNDLSPMANFFGIFSVCIRTVVANSSSIVILPGNSGSPIVDIYGQVIGVAFAANEYGTRSYTVPLSYLKDFLEGL